MLIFLGKSYQESRMTKRDRKQPTKIVSDEFKMWEKTGQAPGGLYGVRSFITEFFVGLALNPNYFQGLRNSAIAKICRNTTQTRFHDQSTSLFS